MKRIVIFVLAVLATPALASTFINVDASSASFPVGTVATSGVWPSAGVTVSSLQHYVDFPSAGTNNCVNFEIPAVPQTMSSSPTLSCKITAADASGTGAPLAAAQFTVVAQAYPAGDAITGNTTTTIAGVLNLSLAGSSQNQAIVSPNTNAFPINKNANVACGAECLGRPLVFRLCRNTASSADTVRFYNLTCEE